MSDDITRTEANPETMPGGPSNPSSTSNEQTVIKSDKIWFEDGNIILQTATKRYRVHKSVLATHSSVFKDMLSLPQPVEETEVFEGCPIVHVTDLTEDWDEFLPLLYYMRDLRDKWGQIHLYLMVAMLRLGHKYGCDRLRDQALEEFRLIFPKGFHSYKHMLEGDTIEDSLREEFVYNNELYLLDVALDLGLQTVLPLAFFACLKNYTTAQLLDGSYNVGPARSGILRPQICEVLIQAKEKMIMDISDKSYAWWKQAKPSASCTTQKKCTNAICKEAIYMIGVPDIVEIFTPRLPIESMDSLCTACKGDGIISTDAGRQQVFEKLPSYFGLPEWADLKDFVA